VIDQFTFLNDEIDNANVGGINGVNDGHRTCSTTEVAISYAGCQHKSIPHGNTPISSPVQQPIDDVFRYGYDTANQSNQVSFDERDLELEQPFAIEDYHEGFSNGFSVDQAWLDEYVYFPSMFESSVSEVVTTPPNIPREGGKQTSESRHSCTLCGTTCSRKTDLKRHSRRHDPSARRYSCQGCAMVFLRKDKRKAHQDCMSH
jgi:hypothetical protein